MQNLDLVAEELFNKIRGRFPSVTIGDEEGNVTNEPKLARYFDFNFMNEGRPVGKISISLDDKAVAVVYGEDLVANETDLTKNNWYDFLKELRMFARKRALTFDTRDITKSNLNSRDYKFLAKNRDGDDTMNESKLYGTSRVSYQDFDGARLMIKHTESVNAELATGRTQKIGAIYVESSEGERFKYPYKHLSGARAMARHVAEGGKPFDDFGQHITGLSEELAKLRKFKTYMGRSAVMAESLAGYMDVVKERIATVKKTVESLQKPSYYKEAVEGFETAVLEDVPSDVAENWIDQLTIKQFNEELADVFPYIYKLVSEATRAEELTAEDLMNEKDPCWKGYKQIGMKKKGGKEVPNCVPEELELEAAFEASMGQFSEASNDCDETCPKSCPDCGGTGDPEKFKKMKAAESDMYSDEDLVDIWHNQGEAALANAIGMSEEEFNSEIDANAAETGRHADDDRDDIISDIIVDAVDNADESDTIDVKMTPDGGIEKADAKEQKTPLGEFILSYYDRETGEFPKGETAILTMVEKDYGEEFIEPAKQFIERVYEVTEQYREPEVDPEFDRMRELAGLR